MPADMLASLFMLPPIEGRSRMAACSSGTGMYSRWPRGSFYSVAAASRRRMLTATLIQLASVKEPDREDRLQS